MVRITLPDAHLEMPEEANSRDHRRLGRKMDLYHFQEEVPDSVFWHPKGWALFQMIVGYVRARQAAVGYVEVSTPDILERQAWDLSDCRQNYREHMFMTKAKDDGEFAREAESCLGHMLIYKQGTKSYRDLPLKIAEFGKVLRQEYSDSLYGLMGVRSNTEDDAHIFCTKDQLAAECIEINELILSTYRDFGFDQVHIKLFTRPAHGIGLDTSWGHAESSLKQALDRLGCAYTIHQGEGSSCGPRLEYVLRDAIGREWQCGMLQVDFNAPRKFGAFYTNAASEQATPVMLHRAMFGSIERFTGILIEHYAGKLPLWLAPIQVAVVTAAPGVNEYAEEVLKFLSARGLRAVLDLRKMNIGYKVREHSMRKTPVLFVVGIREEVDRTVSMRRLDRVETDLLDLSEALNRVAAEAEHGRRFKWPYSPFPELLTA